jgi:putative two-component system response regulator
MTNHAPANATTQPDAAGSDRRNKPRIDPAKAAHYDAIYTLARASEAHDEDTGAHVLRIRGIVERIALELGFDEETARDLGHDAMLHDVGKLRIPPSVLKKPAQLDEAERRVMESHTLRGERLLSDRPTMQRASRIARSHHECWDGSGYPEGLRGEEIPLEARITAVADVLDALISERCYKQSWTYEQALEEVISMAGVKLDPTVVEALRRCDADGSLREVFGLS